MDQLLTYFPDLSEKQRGQFATMLALYPEWNARINVISRRDIDNLEERHILHSLAIAKFMTPKPATSFFDLGTGGGFPGLPLAVIWPECRFMLVDRIGKKITVAREIARAAGIDNVEFFHGDSGEIHDRFDYVVSRAVMPLPDLVKASARLIAPKSRNAFPNGLVALKGGDLQSETSTIRRPMIEVPLSDWFAGEFFSTKQLIYVEL